MQKHKNKKLVSPEMIADMADKGEDVTKFFAGKGQMRQGVGAVEKREHGAVRVNVDFSPDMLTELDEQATKLNISRQAVIKMMVRLSLNQLQGADHARVLARG
jgi:hypothetical protein